jgi:two-component system, OmpR family, phosphate regulon sensor histidine kinase PhoR
MAIETQLQPVAGAPVRRTSRLRVFTLLFISFLVLIAAAAFATIYASESFWQKTLRDQTTRDLTQKAQMFATRVNTDRSTRIADLTAQAGQQAGARATVVDGNGKVIADSQVPVASLEKEGERPEFKSALRGETGVETRGRGAFPVPVLYVAVPVSGGAVRLACSLADIDAAVSQERNILALGCVVAVLAGLIISAMTARMVSTS